MTTTEERLSHLEGAYEHLATKADLQALETRMIKQIADSETRMTKQITDSETRMTKQIADLNTDSAKRTAESETRIVKWVVGVMIGGIVAGAAFATVIVNLVG